MKILIIAVNIALALLLTGTVTSAFRKDAPRQSHAGRTRRPAKPAKNDDANKNADNDTAPAPLTREEKFNAILGADIFNPERTPNAAFGRRGNRMELSLVGTFEAGKIRGAVILCRTNSRQINPFMRMMWGGGPGGMGMPGMPPGAGGRGGVRRFQMDPGMSGQRRNNNNNNAVKQYVRLGETMPNGYTLTALTRTRATLTRGGDKMELELQMPSQNQNAARRTGPARLNVNQQLQQAQLQTQQMMVRALMEMRGGGGGGNRGGGNRGGNRGGRR